MSEFLAPLNYDRARDALRRLSGYGSYTPEGAAEALSSLRQCYPLVFSKTEQKMFARGSVLIELAGANVTDPLVFTSHLDIEGGLPPQVVPQMKEQPLCVSLSRAHLVALLEALEELLRDGYRPGGDLFLCLSMDGLSGGEGAKAMAGHLASRSINPCFILDHGGYATMDAFRTFLPKDAPLALIGIAEKGLLIGKVTADEKQLSGEVHPVERLICAGARLAKKPCRLSLCPATRQMLRAMSRKAPWFQRFVMDHSRITFPLIRLIWRKRSVMQQFFESRLTLYSMEAKGETASPASRAELSFRQTVIPGQKTAAIRRRLRRQLRDAELNLETQVEYDHSRRSEARGESWDALETAIEIQFEKVIIAPCLCPRTTDARFYTALGAKAYRFSPFMVTGEEARYGLCTVTDGALQTAVQFFRSMLSV
ncbi:MAG: M20/M25/M40 family metallo-hydrolase [Clostridiales bacterium]|nr:M20/M25/M40 family metallo-hydrolase [Clostridiales bacterium]